MQKKKRFLIILLLLSANFSLWADEQEKHEFTLGGMIGYSAFKLKTDLLKPTGGVLTGYNYFFNDIMGISTGLGWTHYQWRLSTDAFSDSYLSHDGEEPFEFRVSFTGYKEDYTTAYLIIPLALRLQYPLFSDENLTYFSIGGKANFPLRSHVNTSGTTFTTSGYYPAYDIVLETPESQGFGTFTSGKQSMSRSLRTMWTLSAEAGMKWDFAPQLALYAGLYVDYALNGISNEKGKTFLEYNRDDPTNWSFNSMLNARYTQEGKTHKFVNRTSPFAVGIVIRIAFKLPE